MTTPNGLGRLSTADRTTVSCEATARATTKTTRWRTRLNTSSGTTMHHARILEASQLAGNAATATMPPSHPLRSPLSHRTIRSSAAVTATAAPWRLAAKLIAKTATSPTAASSHPTPVVSRCRGSGGGAPEGRRRFRDWRALVSTPAGWSAAACVVRVVVAMAPPGCWPAVCPSRAGEVGGRYEGGCGGMGAGSWPLIPAAAVVACGGTTSKTTRSWAALVSPIVWAFIWRNQPTRTRRPSTATRRGALPQASRLSATRVTGPREESRPAMRPGSSASGSRERGHQPPSTAPVPAIVGSSCSRSPGGADGRVEGGAVVGVLVAGVMSSAPSSMAGSALHGVGLRSGGSCWGRLRAGVGQGDRRDRCRCAGPAGRRVGVVAGRVYGAAEPVAQRGAGPGPRPGRRPPGGFGGGGVGQELPDRPDSATVQLIEAVTAEPVQLTGNLGGWSGQGPAGPEDHDLLAVGVQRPAAAAGAGRAGRGAKRDLTGGEGP